MKVIIVGGVAGGASAAARLRRLDEHAEIILLERGAYVSYANCGLPYYIGGVIAEKSALTVQTTESLRERLKLDVRTRHEAVAVYPDKKLVEIRDLDSAATYTESYDKLILSPGAEAVRPAFPGADDARVFTLRTIPDTYRIADYIKKHAPKRALVVGAGFIGLEMAENLVRAGLQVTVAELSNHAIAALDADMAADVHLYLRQQGVGLQLENGVQSIEPSAGGLHVVLNRGSLEVDMVLLSIGVRPESALANAAGLEVTARGTVVVDAHMRTSNADIYAVGDVVQIVQPITGQPGYTPLAGPANKQGRIAADNIAGLRRVYRGTQGTAIMKLFDMAVGATGLNEAAAQSAGLDYDKVYLMPASHAGYYPGAEPLSMKVLFEKGAGRILGAQLLGYKGVDKRLDVLATAICAGMTADDLTELELAYAPPFSSAKDPVNMAGYLIQELLEGDVQQFHWQQVAGLLQEGFTLVDVRTPEEYARNHIEGAVNIPLDDLRGRLDALDKSKPQYIYCQSGQRSYLAGRILAGSGFTVSHLAGGYQLYASAALGVPTPFIRGKQSKA
ncbi:MAG: FAD-dependent oxidoreductase [Ruminococcaceae bacterium]|nr:FAD-dependent oxidoreductase [Oscillospiraceae bacterium]